MAVWVCLDCSTRYLVGQSRCPHCGSTIYRPEDDMPKISKEGGEHAVTNALAESEPAVREMLQGEAEAGVIPEDRVDLEARDGVTLDDEGHPVDPEDVPYGATVTRANENTASLVHDSGPLAEGADGTGVADVVTSEGVAGTVEGKRAKDVEADHDATDGEGGHSGSGASARGEGVAKRTTAAGAGSSDKSEHKTGGGKTSGPTASGAKPSTATTGKRNEK